MRGESRRRTGRLKSSGVQPGNCTQDTFKRAELMAELMYLDHLAAKLESNVASLKRLKEACDALMENGQVFPSPTLHSTKDKTVE